MNPQTLKTSSYKTLKALLSVCAFSVSVCSGQSAKVDPRSLTITPNTEKKEVSVSFRLSDSPKVASVEAATSGKNEKLSTIWNSWETDSSPGCSWMLVLDTSDPRRIKTIVRGIETLKSFLPGLRKQDTAGIYTLALNLDEACPLETNPENALKALGQVKLTTQDSSKTTLIFSNLRAGLKKFESSKSARKAVLLMTDGKDETPGGAAAQDIECKKLIQEANRLGVIIHTIGYAETTADQSYFSALKDISSQTEGLFVGAGIANKELPQGYLDTLHLITRGAGRVTVNLSTLQQPAPLTLTIKTFDNRSSNLEIPVSKVAEALGIKPSPAAKTPDAQQQNPSGASDQPSQAAEAPGEGQGNNPAKDKTKSQKPAVSQMALLAGGAGILVLALLIGRSRGQRRLKEQEEKNRQIEAERTRVTLERTREPDPLAWIEMCDAQQSKHPIKLDTLKIGRGNHNDLVLRNDSVSGNHCIINLSRQGKWTITDINSGNGVLLNGQQVQQAQLKHGDVFELGEIKMRFLLKA
jgi:hypothetical protein